MTQLSYYIIKRARQYDEIVKSRGVRTIRHAVYSRPDAASVISIERASSRQIKNYLQRTGKTDDEIEVIQNVKLWYKKKRGEP